MFLKPKQILILVMKEQNITVKNAAVIMDIYLMMGPNQQEKDIVIMVCVWFLFQERNNLMIFPSGFILDRSFLINRKINIQIPLPIKN